MYIDRGTLIIYHDKITSIFRIGIVTSRLINSVMVSWAGTSELHEYSLNYFFETNNQYWMQQIISSAQCQQMMADLWELLDE